MALSAQESLQLHSLFSAVTDFQQVANAAGIYYQNGSTPSGLELPSTMASAVSLAAAALSGVVSTLPISPTATGVVTVAGFGSVSMAAAGVQLGVGIANTAAATSALSQDPSLANANALVKAVGSLVSGAGNTLIAAGVLGQNAQLTAAGALVLGVGYAMQNGEAWGQELPQEFWDWLFDPNAYAMPDFERSFVSMLLDLSNYLKPIDPRSRFDPAQRSVPIRRDPLTLDLDGDGIETVALSATNPVLFDHDGDGLKTGTGCMD